MKNPVSSVCIHSAAGGDIFRAVGVCSCGLTGMVGICVGACSLARTVRIGISVGLSCGIAAICLVAVISGAAAAVGVVSAIAAVSAVSAIVAVTAVVAISTVAAVSTVAAISTVVAVSAIVAVTAIVAISTVAAVSAIVASVVISAIITAVATVITAVIESAAVIGCGADGVIYNCKRCKSCACAVTEGNNCIAVCVNCNGNAVNVGVELVALGSLSLGEVVCAGDKSLELNNAVLIGSYLVSVACICHNRRCAGSVIVKGELGVFKSNALSVSLLELEGVVARNC